MNRQNDTVECLRGIIVADCIYRRNRNNHSMNRQSDTVECLRGIIVADCIYRRNRQPQYEQAKRYCRMFERNNSG